MPNQYIRIIIGSITVIGLTMLVGNQIYNGSGGEGDNIFAIACAISFVLSGYSTLFPGPNFIYSKLRIENIEHLI